MEHPTVGTHQKFNLHGEKTLQEDQSWMLPLSIWSHTIEHGDVEEVDNIQAAIGKKNDIIKPTVAENVDSNLMVYSRRPGLSIQPMQKQNPISLTHDQSSSPKLGTFNPSLLNHGLDTDLDVPIAIRKSVRSCTKHHLSNFISHHKLCLQYKAFIIHLS